MFLVPHPADPHLGIHQPRKLSFFHTKNQADLGGVEKSIKRSNRFMRSRTSIEVGNQAAQREKEIK